MLNAIIVDDEVSGAGALNLLIGKYCPEVKVLAVVHSANEAEKKINALSPNLVFLDVEMPHADGFQLLKRFKELNFDVIFTTAYNEYALKAIKHNALDYLLKPIDIDELKAAVKKCEEKQSKGQTDFSKVQNLLTSLAQTQKVQKLPIPTPEEIVYVDIDDIVRCEADSNYTSIFLKDKRKITSSKTLKDYEQMLSDHPFFRIHKTHLINLSCVARYIKGDGGYVVMQDGVSLEVSRQKKAELLAVMSR
ncbi:MAG TPA: LytTR family DNA-binding domain-containing protein [Bacteroidia bacterium]|jgi:two-component system LytT family response regulator|nr:LytTR family DNA-binding domain-containing protein [Bacteroidia bacterium]